MGARGEESEAFRDEGVVALAPLMPLPPPLSVPFFFELLPTGAEEAAEAFPKEREAGDSRMPMRSLDDLYTPSKRDRESTEEVTASEAAASADETSEGVRFSIRVLSSAVSGFISWLSVEGGRESSSEGLNSALAHRYIKSTHSCPLVLEICLQRIVH